MAGRQCDGKVHSLKGRTICFTGRALVDGKWMVRKRCAEKAERLGATYRADFSGGVTLVVYGDLAGKVVTDPSRAYSSTLVDAEEERSRGRHVCVVDGDGFSNLLRHRSAPCLELRRTGQGRVRPVAPLEVREGILGESLRVRRIGRHAPKALTMDLDHLDKATAAHESTVGALIAHLGGRGIDVRTYARNAPRFDAGWSHGAEVFIAEVKSLSGTSEDQQIRLGIGQVLDYTHQIRTAHPDRRVHPVLVLEKRPIDARWAALAESLGIRLTWAPEFTGL